MTETEIAISTRQVRVGLGHVRVRVTGQGEPLVLIMGIGGHLDMWTPLADQLPGRQLVMFDFPGTGGSTAPWFPPTMFHGALFVRLLLSRLGLQQVDIVGYSWGGLLAQAFAAQHPGKVRKLILACTGPGPICVPADPRVAARLLTPRRYYSSAYLAKIAAQTYGGEFRRQPGLVRAEAARRVDHPPGWIGYMWQLIAAGTFSVIPFAHRIKHPTLVLGGDDDPIVRTANQYFLHRILSQSEVQVIEKAGHLMLVDSPSTLAPIMETFLSAEEA
ncbi:alpha/beta fold hydrolase [Angustibacter luteus]|uniref:Alpha/beta fold hydrolase n=1 Tax=Angustibacter luteus TaxID=658456 RepID=A0ABW1JES7_9ACTN